MSKTTISINRDVLYSIEKMIEANENLDSKDDVVTFLLVKEGSYIVEPKDKGDNGGEE